MKPYTSHLKHDTLAYYLYQALQEMSQTGWVSKGSLYVVGERGEYSPETVGRTLRSMAENNIIQVSEYKGKRGQTLARYSVEPQQVKPKIYYEPVEVDGRIIMRQVMS